MHWIAQLIIAISGIILTCVGLWWNMYSKRVDWERQERERAEKAEKDKQDRLDREAKAAAVRAEQKAREAREKEEREEREREARVEEAVSTFDTNGFSNIQIRYAKLKAAVVKLRSSEEVQEAIRRLDRKYPVMNDTNPKAKHLLGAFHERIMTPDFDAKQFFNILEVVRGKVPHVAKFLIAVSDDPDVRRIYEEEQEAQVCAAAFRASQNEKLRRFRRGMYG